MFPYIFKKILHFTVMNLEKQKCNYYLVKNFYIYEKGGCMNSKIVYLMIFVSIFYLNQAILGNESKKFLGK